VRYAILTMLPPTASVLHHKASRKREKYDPAQALLQTSRPRRASPLPVRCQDTLPISAAPRAENLS